MKTSSARRSNRELTEETRARLLAAGRRLFGDCGFSGTSTAALSEEAGLTRGALQYQFGDKAGLFAAVFDTVLTDAAEVVATQTMDHSHGVGEVGTGLVLFARALDQPGVRRVVLEDGPSTLGWAAWRSRVAGVALPLLRHAVGHWAEAGRIAPDEVDGLAELLLAAALHAALARAGGDHGPDRALARLVERLAGTETALRAGPATATSTP